MISFILIMIGATVVVFPYPENMVNFLKEAGMLEEARYILNDLLSKSPENPQLLSLSGKIFHLNGNSERAIRDLKRAVEIDPENEEFLLALATYHEWDRSPLDALPVWEKIVTINPDNLEAQIRLIDYYRYYGFPKIESEVLANLIKTEQKNRHENITLKEEMVWEKPLVKELTRELNHLAEIREINKEDSFFDNLFTGMYIIRRQYMDDLREKSVTAINDADKGVAMCFELFVKTGKIDMGFDFAHKLDRKWDQEMKNRMSFLDVARWSGIHDKALVMLEKMYEEYPQNHQILYLIARSSRETDDLETSITAYEKLVAIEPDNRDYTMQLASLYLEVKQAGKAHDLLKEIATGAGRHLDYINMLADSAITVGSESVMIETAELIGQLMPGDRDVVKKQADIYLAANHPEKAYPILRQLAGISGENPEEVLKMLEVAEFTSREAIIKEAIAKAFELRPDDSQVVLRVAEMYQGIGDEKRAIEAYVHYLKLYPEDRKTQKVLAQLYLWTNQQEKAAGLMVKIANENPGEKSILIEAARYSEEAGFIEQAFTLYEKLYADYPEDLSIQNDLIRIASWSNKWVYAAALLGKISDSDARNFKKALDAGNAFISAEDLKNGIGYIERAITLSPDNTDLRKELAEYYGWLGLREKKIMELEYLGSTGSLDKEEKVLLAQAYLDSNEGSKALKYLKQYEKEAILKKKEGLMLARAYELIGKNETAIRVYKRLAKENMGDPEFLARLGNQALWINYTDAALEFFEGALRIDSRNLMALKSSAQIWAGRNSIKRAIKLYVNYNKLKPDDYEAHFQLGELFFSQDQKTDAFKEYNRSLRLMKKSKRLAESNLLPRVALNVKQ